MGGFPLQQMLEGTPPNEPRRGVAIDVSLLAGQAVGIDASVMMYKLVVGNLQMLRECRQRRYKLVAEAMVERMLRLVEAGVTPIVVFDGAARYPPKSATHCARVARRQAADARLVAGGLVGDAELRALGDAFAPSRELVAHVLACLHELGLAAVVAPMEADAQLAYLDRFGFTGYTMTVDNDLLALGCRRVIFDWNWRSLKGVAYALDSTKCVRGKFTEVFLTDAGTRCPFADMRPIMQLFAALAGCDYSKFDGVGAARAEAAMLHAPVLARIRATDVRGAARVAVARLRTTLGRPLRCAGSDVDLSLDAAQDCVLHAMDAFDHPPVYSLFAGAVVPLSLVELPPAHLDLDFGNGAGGLNAAPLAAFVGNALNADLLANRLLDFVGDAFLEFLVPHNVRGGEWTSWELRREALVRGKPHGLRIDEFSPGVLARVSPDNLRYYLRIRQIVVGATVLELQARVSRQLWIEATQLVPLPLATDPGGGASGELLRKVRLAQGAIAADLAPTEPVAMPAADDERWRTVQWDALSDTDGRAAFMLEFPLVRDEIILAFFRERSFVRLKAVRAGAFRCRMLRSLDGLGLVWATPAGDSTSVRTHYVSMSVQASYAHAAYVVTLRIEVEHPNFEADELPEGMLAFASVRSIVHSSCSCKAGHGRCLHGSVLAHVLLNLPRPRSTEDAPAPPEASSTEGPCMWKQPGATAAALAAQRRPALVQTVTVPLPKSGYVQARHDATLAARGGRASFLGAVPERAARALAQQRESGALSPKAGRLRDNFLLLQRTKDGPSSYEVTYAAEPDDVRAWMNALSNGGDGSAASRATRAAAIAAALENLGSSKRRRDRLERYEQAKAAAVLAGAAGADAAEAVVAAMHGPALLPTPARAPLSASSAPSESPTAAASTFRPYLRHHPHTPIPAPGARATSPHRSVREHLCGWCGPVQRPKAHWPQLGASAAASAGAGAAAGGGAGHDAAPERRVPHCVAHDDARTARRVLLFERYYNWPLPGETFASANPRNGKGRKRKRSGSFVDLLAAAAAAVGEGE
jgi:hypothetical protein